MKYSLRKKLVFEATIQSVAQRDKELENIKEFIVIEDGTSLVVQWLRIHLAMQGTLVQSLVGALRSHTPRGN